MATVTVPRVRTPVVALKDRGLDALTANVPDAFGSVSVGVPAVACGVIVAVPLVLPVNANVPLVVPAIPNVGVAL